LTYRDLTQSLDGLERFVPVRSDSDRIMLGALDYQDADTVTVNDLVYTPGGSYIAHRGSRSGKATDTPAPALPIGG